MPLLQHQSFRISNSICKPVNTEKEDMNPPWAVRGELSKEAQRYQGYNGGCSAPLGLPPGTVRAYE